jgi:hypothetical protein
VDYSARQLYDNLGNFVLDYATPGNMVAQYDFQALGIIRAQNLIVNGITQQSASNAFSSIVIDNASGTIRTAPVTTGLQPVIENTFTTPPGTPNAGDSYLVPSGATGAWSGQTNKIATWSGSAWTFYTPSTNDQTTVLTGVNAGKTYIYNGSAWVQTNITVSAWQLNGNTVGSVKTLGTLDSYDLPFITGAVERMRLTSTGRLGIGTTSPATPFHLVGTARLASYTIGAIPFIDSNTNLAQDTTSLWWDATNARLALGTSVTGTNYPPTMTSNSAPSPYVASASVGNATAFNAFDNNGSTSWNAGVATGILTIDMGSTISVNQYAITGPWNISVNAAPQAWTFEGSPNGSSWTVLDTRTAQSTWAFSETKTYTLSASQSYRYYRLNVTANNGNALLLITQLTISNATTDHVTPLAKAHIGTYLASSSAGAIGQIIQGGQAGQTSDWFQIRDQSANILASFSSTPGTYLNFGDLAGRSAFGAIGAVVAGDKIIFKNGSGDGSTGKFAIGLNTNNNYYIQAIGTTGQPNLDIVTGNSTTGAANFRFTFNTNLLINTLTDTGHKLSIADTTSAGSGSLANSTINMATTWNTTGSPSLINGTITATAFGTSSKYLNFTTGTANTYLGVLSSAVSANTSEQAFYATNGTNSVLIGVGSGGVVPAGTVYFRVNSTTGLSFSSTTTNIPTGYLNMSNTAGSNQITGNQSSASTAITALKLGSNTPSSGGLTMTTGNQIDVMIGGLSNYSFQPTSGSATYTQLSLTPTINQTGGASGVTRSIYVNPTVTAAYDYRAFESTVGKVIMGGNLSAPAWTTNGVQLIINPATYTDTSSTVGYTTSVANSFGAPTFAASNAIGITNLVNLYLNAPVAGTNVTPTNRYALYSNGNNYFNGTGFFNSTGSSVLVVGAVVGNNPTMSISSTNGGVESLNISASNGLAGTGFYASGTVQGGVGYVNNSSFGVNSTVTLRSTGSVPLVFMTNATERMRITSTGFWTLGGFATNSITGYLGTFYTGYTINATGSGATGYFVTTRNTNSMISATGAYYNSTNMTATETSSAGYWQDAGSHRFFTNTGLTVGNTFGATEQFRIDSTGYVGVGVTSPSALLSVAGSTTTRASMNIATGTAPTSANSGDVWHDATQKTTYINNAGVNQSHSGTLFTQTADATCANTTTETTLTSTGVGTLTLPANFFVAGKTIKLQAYGFHSSTSGTTVTIRIKLGSTTILTATGTSGPDTNAGIIMDTVITCRTTGASGTVSGQGVYTEIGNSPNFRQMTNTAAVTVDTTTSQAISMTAQWGAASAGRTITVTNLSVQVLN